jgi:nitrite reductase/ring-hydroxylating ferredoxin subunit
MAFVTVATLEQLRDGTVMRVEVAEQALLIYRDGTVISAVSAHCTHLHLSLPSKQENGIVTCAFHGAEFELLTGQCRHFPDSRTVFATNQSHDLQTFAVRILENRVQVDCGSIP